MAVLMMMNPPAPDRIPYLNALAAMGLDLEVIYVPIGPDEHGWGEFRLDHPHRMAKTTRQATSWAIREISRGRVDVLCCFGYRTPPFAAPLILAGIKNIPTVVRSDTNIDAIRKEPTWKRRTRRALAKAIIPRRTVAWTVGSKNSCFWREEIGLKQEVRIPFEVLRLPGGSQPRARTIRSDGTLRILFVGRIVPVKRVEDLLDAVISLPDSCPWRLTVVGAGPELSRLQGKVSGDPRIDFVGSVVHDRLDRYFVDADVLVLPSSYEPWGLVVNEALGFGLHVIASEAVGAAADLINSANGCTYPPGDVKALTRALLESVNAKPQPGMGPRTDTSQLMFDSIANLRRHKSSAGPLPPLR